MNKEDWVVSAPVILTVAGLDFTVHNNGQHIVIVECGSEYHLWPSTGKWRCRYRNRWGIDSITLRAKYRGVRGLVLYLTEEK